VSAAPPPSPAQPSPGASGPRGLLVVVSGPSGVGKTAVVERLLRHPRFARAVTATTRAPRGAEREGVDYVFLGNDEFERRVAAGWFLEHADVYGHRYGTPREGPEAITRSGRHCLLVIDVQGASTLRSQRVPATFVFVAPPSLDELERRLRHRAQDGADSVARRRAVAEKELAQAQGFDLIVVNRDVEATARKVAKAVGVDLDSASS
jgi:guanylate kinase